MDDGRLLLFQERDSREWTTMMQLKGVARQWHIWRTIERHELLVMGHMEETKVHGAILHVSMSYEKFYPSWEEIKQIKRLFFGPERDAMQILARDSQWVNLQKNCFHLYECPQDWETL